MNISNALGFLILGTLMQLAPELGGSMVSTSDSVRGLWVDFMSWVIAGIGFGYLSREGLARLPALVTSLVPERLVQHVAARQASETLQSAGARVGVSN